MKISTTIILSIAVPPYIRVTSFVKLAKLL